MRHALSHSTIVLSCGALLVALAERNLEAAPLIPQQQGPPLVADDGAVGSQFGSSVAASGDSVLVGAPRQDPGGRLDQGAAYVFVRDGATWSQQGPALVASDGASGDRFGLSVALSGDTAVVGAPRHAVGENSYQGVVYVFVRTGEVWTQQGPPLFAADGTAGDGFGTSVALSGDAAVVGAPAHDSGRGAAYAFARSGETWNPQEPVLRADDGEAGDALGSCVAVDRDTVLVTAPVHQVGDNRYQGSAYVFLRSGTSWEQQGRGLNASSGGSFDQLGACALSGETALLGAPYHLVGSNPGQGAAAVFVRTSGAWTEEAELTLPEGRADDWMGASVALSGDTALVLAAGRESGADASRGALYAFTRDGTTWLRDGPVFVVAGNAATDTLGPALGLSLDTALVGAPLRNIGDATYQGAAYVVTFDRNPESENPGQSPDGCACHVVADPRAAAPGSLAGWSVLLSAVVRRRSRRHSA